MTEKDKTGAKAGETEKAGGGSGTLSSGDVPGLAPGAEIKSATMGSSPIAEEAAAAAGVGQALAGRRLKATVRRTIMVADEDDETKQVPKEVEEPGLVGHWRTYVFNDRGRSTTPISEDDEVILRRDFPGVTFTPIEEKAAGS